MMPWDSEDEIGIGRLSSSLRFQRCKDGFVGPSEYEEIVVSVMAVLVLRQGCSRAANRATILVGNVA